MSDPKHTSDADHLSEEGVFDEGVSNEDAKAQRRPPVGRADESNDPQGRTPADASESEANETTAGKDVTNEDSAPLTVDQLLEHAKGEVAELGNKLRRAEASFLNETKRMRKNAETQQKFAIERVIVDLLPVLDALHSARAGFDGVGEGEGIELRRQMIEGLDLIEKQFSSVLSRHGVEPIEALHTAFDPSVHEAMMVMEQEGVDVQTVTEVFRPGYTLRGRVVRPAQVVVTKPPAPPADAAESNSSDATETSEG